MLNSVQFLYIDFLVRKSSFAFVHRSTTNQCGLPNEEVAVWRMLLSYLVYLKTVRYTVKWTLTSQVMISQG